MRARTWLAFLAALGLALPALAQRAPATPAQPAPPAKVRQLDVSSRPWTGDFDAMLERRMIRVYAPFSRTLYFSDRGRERGITAELVRDWERYLNKKYAKRLKRRPITVYLAPATRDKLLPYLEQGLADVAAGNLTITADRLEEADFVPGNLGGRVVDEVVVTGPKSPEVASIDDLGGKTVHVRKSSSYYDSLEQLNERLGREGKPPVKLVLVPDSLEDEDLMEMLDAGLLELLVVDDWKAGLWARVLPKLKVRTDLVLRDNGRPGWAVRKGSTKLEAEIAEFFAEWVRKNGIFEGRLGSYTKRAKELRDPTASRDYRRFQQLIAIFEKYGEKYQFDPLMLAAQGYQESQLNQAARSAVGAIGVMQVMPATGAQMNVGDIHVAEANIHAGAKYMDHLMEDYFRDAHFDPGNRTLMAFASYNCGPGNIARMRKEAVKRGLDPDKWFNNVELVVAERIGLETTTYVRNIYKYYVAYRLTMAAQEEARKAREAGIPGTR